VSFLKNIKSLLSPQRTTFPACFAAIPGAFAQTCLKAPKQYRQICSVLPRMRGLGEKGGISCAIKKGRRRSLGQEWGEELVAVREAGFLQRH